MTRYADIRRTLAARPHRWLVTGAAGFIGSALVEELLGLGQDVVGLDSFATGKRENVAELEALAAAGHGKFRFVEGDIRDLAACRRACDGVGLVLHQAALGSVPRSIEDPLASHQANVDGFLHMLIAARDAKVSRVVFASSSSVYGDHPGLPKVEDRIGAPLSPYAATKRIDELYAAVVQATYGLELTGLRYFNVFGRRQDPDGPYAAVIPRWLARLARGERCVIFGDGSQSRDFCYIDNTVQANLLAATAEASTTHQIYNVGCRGRTSLVELYGLIRAEVAERFPAAAKLEPQHESPRAGDVQHSQASIDKISQALGYQPSHDVAQGMVETVRWFLARA